MASTKKGGLGRSLGALLQPVPQPVAPAPLEEPADVATAEPGQANTATPANTPARTNTPAQAKPTAAQVKDTVANARAGGSEHGVVEHISVDEITRGTYQPRMQFEPEALQELADSIKAQGLIQPILVRRRGAAFELIAGERRWRATQLAGLTHIPAIIRDMSDHDAAAVTLIENIQREDLNALEEAGALHRLKTEFGMNDGQVGRAVGRSRTAVANLIRLLDLDDRVAQMLLSNKIDMGHARALLSLPADDQHMIAMRVYAEGLTVRAVEALVREGWHSKNPSRKPSPKADQDTHIKALQSQLSDKLGANVKIAHNQGGKGSITVTYNSLDELDGILSHIN